MNEHEFYCPTSDETCYFSALEEIQPDEQSQTQQTIDSLDSEHYYTQLRLDEMASRTYFTIEIKADQRDSYYQIDIDTNSSRRILIKDESRMQRERKSREPEHDDPFEPRFTSTRIGERKNLNCSASNEEIEKILDDLTDDLRKNFEKKFKNPKLKHENLDQVIEDTLDETGFEDMTDSLIQSVAAESQSHSKLIESLKADELNETFIHTQNEMSLIRHSFHLVKKVNLSSMGQVFDQFLKKLEILSETAVKTVRPVARVFRDLFSLNFSSAVSNLSVVSFTDRWNVIKNMLYYSARMILLRISSFYRSDSIRAEYKCVRIEENETSKSIRDKIRNEFDLEPYLYFRIRNWRGNLVPLNDTLATNSKKNAYKIEPYVPIVRKKIPIDSVAKVNRVTTALATNSIIYGFYQKLFRLETAFKFAQNQLEKNLENRLDDMENRINFLEKRFDIVENFDWEGSFKKPLLW